MLREFPGKPVVRTQHFYCWDPGLTSGWRTKILQDARCHQKKRELDSYRNTTVYQNLGDVVKATHRRKCKVLSFMFYNDVIKKKGGS